MSLLDSIRAAKQLRKVGSIAHDASAPSLIVDTLQISNKYDTLVLQANIENWNTLLSEFTPKTILVPLTPAQGTLLLRAYEALESAALAEAIDAAAAQYVRSGKTGAPLVPEESLLLEQLGQEIQTAIDALGGSGCFVKLSSRSPKDAAARSGVFEAHYIRAVQAAVELDDEQRLWILCQSEGAALRFKDAASVVRSLVLSERVWQDMTLAMRHPDTWQQNIILREWQPVPIDMEFRTFISKTRMTAISQYAYQLCSPRLTTAEKLDPAIAAIRTLYEDRLRPILSASPAFADCVIEFGVIPPESEGGEWRAIVIEINPFEETTDGGLFSWTRERQLIEGTEEGVEYPVVRVTERKRTGALAMVPSRWKEVVRRVEGRT
ncbi:hypothetical protein FB45DRAFT_87601 [Roridomyces roridus]|uniref:Cell division cycle protein 123 n=1 Tax=Roridomyces roridus TaxID=1738132 RepID=A0AAD7BM30_9AGAR|nr:hypothetical protein FB45DRAFT_87601 [Roridomyces roridus]